MSVGVSVSSHNIFYYSNDYKIFETNIFYFYIENDCRLFLLLLLLYFFIIKIYNIFTLLLIIINKVRRVIIY